MKKKNWVHSEDVVAKKTGARKTIASGSKYEKGDCVNSTYCFEVKSTIRKYYTLTIEALFKIKKQAGKCIPVFVIEFGDGLQRYLVLSQDNEVPLPEDLKFDWSEAITVRLYSSDLEEDDQILVGKDVWVVSNPKDLKDVQD